MFFDSHYISSAILRYDVLKVKTDAVSSETRHNYKSMRDVYVSYKYGNFEDPDAVSSKTRHRIASPR
uniref:Uncharacterized protein n=1 Tax=Panagrolaimus sp. JU765 TaxID=591449 RepID=A0AC34R2P1_9BILA